VGTVKKTEDDYLSIIQNIVNVAKEKAEKNNWKPDPETRIKAALKMQESGYLGHNRELFEKLAGYYSGWMTRKYTKGLALFGENGVGKTFFIKTMLRPAKTYTTLRLVEHYKEDSYTVFTERLYNYKPYYEETNYNEFSMFIDEVGEEYALNDYGNRMEVFSNVINERHRMFTNHSTLTHFASNLSHDEFKSRYGSRCLSRINEMCYLLEVKGKDLRTLNN